MSFLIDISKLSNWEDIKADRNGVYNGVLRCGVWTVACEVNQNDTSFEIINKKKETLHEDNQYHLTIQSFQKKQGIANSCSFNISFDIEEWEDSK